MSAEDDARQAGRADRPRGFLKKNIISRKDKDGSGRGAITYKVGHSTAATGVDDITLAPDTDGRKPNGAVRLQNVDRVLSDNLRGLTGEKPNLVAKVVLHDSPNTVERQHTYQIDGASFRADWCDLTLSLGNLFDRAWPRPKMDADSFPGLFVND